MLLLLEKEISFKAPIHLKNIVKYSNLRSLPWRLSVRLEMSSQVGPWTSSEGWTVRRLEILLEKLSLLDRNKTPGNSQSGKGFEHISDIVDHLWQHPEFNLTIAKPPLEKKS